MADDGHAQCPLGNKFGCRIADIPALAQHAASLGIAVAGVAFHVGSGCCDANAFVHALGDARAAWNILLHYGHQPTLLDIGGGFPGSDDPRVWSVSFPQLAKAIHQGLDTYWSDIVDSIRIIAEPGRFFGEAAFSLACQVIARRKVLNSTREKEEEVVVEEEEDALNVDPIPPTTPDPLEPSFMYYVNDGVYGSFNCLIYDHAHVFPQVLHHEEPKCLQVYRSSVFGPTCDGLDCIHERIELPELVVGDWLVWHNMGAYTLCAASQFNGFRKSDVVYTDSTGEVQPLLNTYILR